MYVRMHVLYCNLNNCSIPMEERRSKNVCQRRRRFTPTTVFRGRTVFVVDVVVLRFECCCCKDSGGGAEVDRSINCPSDDRVVVVVELVGGGSTLRAWN